MHEIEENEFMPLIQLRSIISYIECELPNPASMYTTVTIHSKMSTAKSRQLTFTHRTHDEFLCSCLYLFINIIGSPTILL